MALFLEIVAGPGKGSRYFIDSAKALIVGRSKEADISFPADAPLSALHCQIAWDGRMLFVIDLQSTNGTFVNGQRISFLPVDVGDCITAGSLQIMRVPLFAQAAMAKPPVRVPDYLSSLLDPLFCLVDAACGPEVYELIQGEMQNAAESRIQCLYDGASAQTLAAYAPYVAQLGPHAPLLESMTEKGWGKGWASYLVSRSSFEDLRHHFRKFLIVKLDSGEEAYFRFYDPRVLRDFLPTCNASELRDFFGPVDAWMVESRDREALLRLTNEGGSLASEEIRTVAS